MITAVFLCLVLGLGSDKSTPCNSSLWPSATAGGGDTGCKDDDGPKNGGLGWHSLCIISPQRLGLDKNEESSKRSNVGVTGIAPVKLLYEMLKVRRDDWFNGGTVPLNLFQSRRR